VRGLRGILGFKIIYPARAGVWRKLKYVIKRRRIQNLREEDCENSVIEYCDPLLRGLGGGSSFWRSLVRDMLMTLVLKGFTFGRWNNEG
jgi:hypothetical protein